MATFTYPTSAELIEIAQAKIPRLVADRPIFQLLPMETADEYVLEWEQEDNFIGLQQLRGLDGAPQHVAAIGGKRYRMDPGVYGEFARITEREMTTRRQYGSFGAAIDIQDLVMRRQDQLLLRRLDRIEYIGWKVLQGTFSVSGGPGDAIVHTDTYSVQTFDAVADSAAWSVPIDAKPLQAFRKVKLLARGYSVNFGAGAQAFMNQATFNELIANTNDADLYGKRTAGLATVLTLAEVNQVLMGEDLPKIVIYDEGYYDDSSAWQLFVPNDKVIIVGKRPAGQVIGAYRMVRNANNPDAAPGPYMKVVDLGETQVPRVIDVHDGHNGGPVVFYPSAICLMSV
jgi:hypothetical protein